MQDTPELYFPMLNARVWNFAINKDKYITDPGIKSTVEALMATHVYRGKTIEDMGILSIGDIDFRDYSPQEAALCNEIRLILFAGALFHGSLIDPNPNKGWSVFTSENFDLEWLSFTEKDDGRMAIISGSIVRVKDMGHKIRDLRFNRPEFVPNPLNFKLDGDIIRLLLKMRKYHKRLYRRVITALELVMQAYYNDSKVPESARILLMASAYEILFNLPEKDQRKELKNKFRQYFVLKNDLKRRFKSHKDKGKDIYVVESIKVLWANSFYQLRNDIIHGNLVQDKDFSFNGKQRHLDVAILFFALGIKKVAGEYARMSITHDYIEWKKHTEPGEPKGSIFNYESFVYEKDWFAGIPIKIIRNKRMKT